jgi:hypothetical protein
MYPISVPHLRFVAVKATEPAKSRGSLLHAFVEHVEGCSSSGKYKKPSAAEVKSSTVGQIQSVLSSLATCPCPEQSFISWFGVVAPEGTPHTIIDLLAGHILEFVQSDEFRTKIAPRYAWDVVKSTPAEFGAFLKADHDAYGAQIKENHIAPIE